MSIFRMNEGLGIAGALIKGAGIGLAMGAVAAERSKRLREASDAQAAIKEFKDSLVRSYPPELSRRLLMAFEASGHNPSFDVDAEVANYMEGKLYLYLLDTHGEDFADRFMARTEKFSRYGVFKPINDIALRTAKELAQVVNAGTLEEDFHSWLKANWEKAEERRQAVVKTAAVTAEVEFIQERCNFFRTDDGIAVIASDYRVVHITSAGAQLYRDLTEFESDNKKNKRWDILQGDKRTEAASRYVDIVTQTLYRST